MLLYVLLAILVAVSILCTLDWVIRSIKVCTRINLEKSHVMVTGGSSGIGLAIAKCFVTQGANVTLVARSKIKLAHAVMDLEKQKKNESQKISIVSVDLTKDLPYVKTSYEEAYDCNGPVDILVNCAGFALCGTFNDTEPEDFKLMMDTNYFGSVNMTKCVVNDMIERSKGHIVFVSSIGGQLGLYGYTAYSASKYALRGFAESLHAELRPHNIGVSIAFPPDTDTPGFENENQFKPEATRQISETAGLFSPDQVAQVIFEGIINRKYLICCGTDGFAMNTLTCGAAPPSSLGELLIQTLLMGPLRFIMVFYLWNFSRIIEKCTRKEAETKNKSD